MSDDVLAPFVAALRDVVDARHAEAAPRRDVFDVVDRALLLDAAAVPTGLRESLPHDDASEAERPDPALAVFAHALRTRTETQVRERKLVPIAMPRPRSLRPIITAATALAAAVALWMWSPRWTTLTEDAPSPPTMMGAEHRDDATSTEAQWIEPDDDEAPEPVPQRVRSDSPVSPIPEEPVLEEPALEDATGQPEPARAPKAKAPALELVARDAWRAGDLEQAERLLRRVVRASGHGRRAELAYGDLFSVVRQRSGKDAQADVWREYLRTFPRGRFAEDARAGLCRRADAAQRAACWSDYLTHHPAGTHAAEARRHTESSEP